jgi:hypothetical protein
MKSFITLSLVLMMSVVASAEVIAKAAAVCLGVEKKDLIRTVYLTMTDKSILVSDPIGYLVKVDKVDRINDNTLKISYSFPESQEALMIYNDGAGELAITNSSGEQKYAMKCYSNQSLVE